MIGFLYNCSFIPVRLGLGLAARFNPKIRSFTRGRKNLFPALENAFRDNIAPWIWIHCASLGEFEQGRPIIERLKEVFPQYKILLTFFSPSGYDVQKNYPLADYVTYLPLDTPAAAKRFVETVNPSLALFVKYEFWHNTIRELKKKNVPLLSVSAIFRKEQPFFRGYGDFFRQTLTAFDHIFVQNQESLALLNTIGIRQCSLAGDTRFDRVAAIVRQGGEIPVAAAFKAGEKLMVAGSCWPDDIRVLTPFINDQAGKMKFIIAPHEISESFIEEMESRFTARSIRYSNTSGGADLSRFDVLIVDNIGMLSRLYRYAEFAFIGGAYGKGLHNILEAACYGIPVFFGDQNYEKYEEANELIRRGGAFAIADTAELQEKFRTVNVPENFIDACEVTRQYVQENLGATEKIVRYCQSLLKTQA